MAHVVMPSEDHVSYRTGVSEEERASQHRFSHSISTPPGSSVLRPRVDRPKVPAKWFHSRRVKKGATPRVWSDKKDPREKWVMILPILGILLGFAASGALIWDGLQTVVTHGYCQILNEDWSAGFDSSVWLKEAEVGGFGSVISLTVDNANARTETESLKRPRPPMKTHSSKAACCS
jgi:hypothetical protein